MGQRINEIKILTDKTTGKRLLGRPGLEWEDKLRTDLKQNRR